ncbi:zinc-binding alcohol dehydrogenase family protein [Azospirillum sp. RWY-5-1]|uniref:Zinc-type alcohol dehydrogenase-like protein n=1 Tax=Azospirillum oleiclasticum TaxID=2735135 RepID=A0ABX2TE70_9PROT|nr:zinc-binding alcohol dehydrogenase family protein [Azospirillum oleiclasticum]NYZ15614.1 zinc-binding alcohol dehydrogenase family protein [Azospirillum oleiclasticum]NYZ22637.1 zinc-binding alcohol dehydrogenase family protein [Azospirillum oleiclasticum]
MKAIGYHRPGPITAADSLVDLELPAPELRPQDLLVRIAAVSVNPVDVKLRTAAVPPEGTARVLGFDAAGVVEAVGPAVTRFKPGDAVFYAGAIDRPGTNAELHAVDERIVGPKPESLSFAEAAALPLTALTAWELLFDRLGVPYGRKTSDDAILIVNGAGGVGSILTQIARRLTGLTVIATASRPETVEWVRRMGAHHVIDHRQPLDQGLKAIGIPQVRYVAGLTATGEHQAAILEVLAPQGALALIDDPKSFDIVPFKRKSLSVHWELMFTRSLFGTPDMAEQHRILFEVSALVDSGVLRTTLVEDYGPITAANLRRAHATVESGRSIGKIVLSGF